MAVLSAAKGNCVLKLIEVRRCEDEFQANRLPDIAQERLLKERGEYAVEGRGIEPVELKGLVELITLDEIPPGLNIV